MFRRFSSRFSLAVTLWPTLVMVSFLSCCPPPFEALDPTLFASGFENLNPDGSPVGWHIDRGQWGVAATVTTTLPDSGHNSVALLRSDMHLYTDAIPIPPGQCVRLEYSVLSNIELAYGCVGIQWFSPTSLLQTWPVSVFSAVGAYGYEHHYENWCAPPDATAARITLHRFETAASAQFDNVRLLAQVH